jgi:predicted nucleic acid-binding protein
VRVFIDSNIPMYVAGKEHPHREPARRFLARVQSGAVEGYTSTEVLQEILYRYVGLRRQDLAVEVYDLFVSLCSAVLPVTLADTDRARDLVREGTQASVRDAVHAAVMLNNDIPAVATFDQGFEQIPGIERVGLG